MAYDLDRKPGAWTRARAMSRQRRLWFGLAVGLVATSVYVALAVNRKIGIGGAALVVVAFLFVKPRVEGYLETNIRWVRGAQSEEAVGTALNELRREGWYLLHDVEQEFEGNIDHIAAGPNGVFMIETKFRRYPDAALLKARRQAAKLGGELGVFVTPVICIAQRRGKPFRHQNVSVVPLPHLLDWLRAQHEKPVPFERLARYADRID
jgi:Nuclease-related domain